VRGAARKLFYPAIFLLIGMGWWFGGAKLFTDAAHYITAAFLPGDAKQPAQGRPQPQIATPRPAPTPRPPVNVPPPQSADRLPPPPAKPPNRPPAEAANPPFAAAQKYEARGDFGNAMLAYNAAASFDQGVGPYGEDSLLGLARMFIKDGTPYGPPAACDTLERLHQKFPNTRPDLLAQTNLARQQAHCPP
jgi:hypothetical protein